MSGLNSVAGSETMGTAHATCDVTIYDMASFCELSAHMLRVLTNRWVRPQSLLVYVPGHVDAKRADTFAKLPGSLDGPSPANHPSREHLFPGERLLENVGVTVLEASESLPSWPRDLDAAVGLVRHSVQRADRFRSSGEDPCAWVYGTFWGSTRIVVPAASGLTTCWALRERVCFSNANLYEPIGEFAFEAQAASRMHGENTFHFHICSFSHIWSHYQPSFDVARDEWPPKPDFTAARENARIAAAAIAELVRFAPATEFEWLFQLEHSPDVGGDLREELNRRLGGDRVRKPTADVTILG
jgi:hypothetical protein